MCAENPNVVSVFLNKMYQLHTTRSWEFLGLERNGTVPKDSTWERARYGEGTIIGNLDSGKFHSLIVKTKSMFIKDTNLMSRFASHFPISLMKFYHVN